MIFWNNSWVAGTAAVLVLISIELNTNLVMVILDLRTPQFLSLKKYNKHFHKGVLQKEVKNITCIFNKNRITNLWFGGETKHILEIHLVYSFSKHKRGVVSFIVVLPVVCMFHLHHYPLLISS